jgi:hypothetical protein
MINRIKKYPLFIFLILGSFFLYDYQSENFSKEIKELIAKIKIKDETKIEIKGKRVVGLSPGKEKEEFAKLEVTNVPSPEWKIELKSALMNQGGGLLKEITLKEVDSFVWVQEGVALFVESVIVTIKNEQDEKTRFKVLVDAQTGKILKNWDQPVIDPGNPRDSFKVKIDPRYNSDL